MVHGLEKKVTFPPAGKYVVAVSGGVDSVSLLHLLIEYSKQHKNCYKLAVAHLDHGMRPDSQKDCKFVAKLAKDNNLKFVNKRIKLGSKASEQTARTARYKFLEHTANTFKGRTLKGVKIVTAHHLDDALETGIFNAVRGTYRLGLTPFNDESKILRPLKNISKAEILKYAKAHKLTWREDATNQNLQISRNYIRHFLLPMLEKSQPGIKNRLLKIMAELGQQNTAAAEKMAKVLSKAAAIGPNKIDLKRAALLQLDSEQVRQVIYGCIKQLASDAELSSQQIYRAEHFTKTATSSKKLNLSAQLQLISRRDTVTFARLR